jgi:tripartite-type tricarboxylate transporter receptor subunit TctC
MAAIRLLFALVAAFALLPAHAQDYPNRPIRVIVPWAAGGGAEITARILGQRLGEQMGATFVVETRPGAASMIGTEAAARSQPDGYTLLFTDAPVTINPAIHPRVGYDLRKDFVPVSRVSSTPVMLVSNPSVPAATIAEYLALAKGQPGRISVGHGGVGSTTHMVGELLQLRAGVQLNHIPYKGTGPAVADCVAGQVNSATTTMPGAIAHIKAGRLRALAVASSKRLPALPEVPTFEQAGVAGVIGENWSGILAPAGVSPEIVARLNQEIVKAVQHPQVQEKLVAASLEPQWSTPGEFRAFLDAELKKWAEVVKAANIKAD